MTRATATKQAAPTPPAGPWSVLAVESWVRGPEAALTLSLGGQAGAAFALAGQRALDALDRAARDRARELSEHGQAVAARLALLTAQAKETQLAGRLDELQKTTLDFNGDLAGHAQEQASALQQLAVIRERLPRLRQALAEATTALVNATSELRASLRLAALAEARQQRESLAGKLLDAAAVAGAVEAGVVVDTLSRGFDEVVAQRLVGVEVPAVESTGPAPEVPRESPFQPPAWACQPPEWPRPALASTPPPPQPQAPPEGWKPVSPDQVEKLREDAERQRLVAEHAREQRERQQREAAGAAAPMPAAEEEPGQ
jgi:hypothetical protein